MPQPRAPVCIWPRSRPRHEARSRSLQPNGQQMNREPNAPADKRSVEANELQVPADIELEFFDDFVLFPFLHLARDEYAQLRPEMIEYTRHVQQNLLVDDVPHSRVAVQR